jgi:hypothetical protein
MSRPEAIDLETLRGRLEYALRFDVAHDGSLYLNAMAVVYLACDEQSTDESAALEALVTTQAEIEGVDSDDVLTALCLAIPADGAAP